MQLLVEPVDNHALAVRATSVGGSAAGSGQRNSVTGWPSHSDGRCVVASIDNLGRFGADDGFGQVSVRCCRSIEVATLVELGTASALTIHSMLIPRRDKMVFIGLAGGLFDEQSV